MTDHEPNGEYTQYDGGAAATGEQPYSGTSASAHVPAPAPPPEQQRSPYARPIPEPDDGAAQPSYAPPAQPSYPPPAQPSYPQPGYSSGGYGGGYLAGDVLVAGPPQRHRRNAAVVISVVAVLAIVLGGGGFTAYRLLAASGGQPDKWAPSDSIAYAKIDLDPSASAKVAAWQFEKKFPNAPKIASADDLKDGLLQAMFADDQTDPVDYDADIKPWLGDRAAVDVFVDSNGKPQTIGVLAVKDAGKAKTSLQKVTKDDPSGPIGYAIKGSFVIIGQSQAIVDEAVAAASQSNITNNADYKNDIAKLSDDRIATGWWDIGATLKAVSADIPAGAGALLTSGGMAGLAGLSKVRMVAGLRVQPDYVEVQGFGVGAPSTLGAQAGTAGAALGDLPEGTVAGVSITNPEKGIKNELDTLQNGLLGAGMKTELDTLGAQLGISLPGDIENLLGSELTVGLDAGLKHGQNLDDALVRVVTRPDDPAKGLHTAHVLAQALSADSGLSFSAASQGPTVVITNDDQPAGSKLADSASFKKALAGMPSKVGVAAYVNISAILSASGASTPDSAPLDSIGFYSGRDSSSDVFTLRLTVK